MAVNPDAIVLQLDGMMVTWADLGVGHYTVNQCEKIYYEKLIDWLDKCQGDYRADVRGVWFARSKEAVMFKVTFAGSFNN